MGDLSELKNKQYEDVVNGKEGLEPITEPDREFSDIHLNDLEVRENKRKDYFWWKTCFFFVADKKIGDTLSDMKNTAKYVSPVQNI